MNLDPSNPNAYRQPDQPVPPNVGTSFGGMPGANASFANAQGLMAKTQNTLKMMQIGLTVLGAFFVLGGISTLIFSSLVGGICGIAVGGSIIWSAWKVMPQYMSQLTSAQTTVNGLAAQAQVAQNGIPTMARVLQIVPTGGMVNHGPEVNATLEVQGPQGPYVVQTRAVISPMYIPQFQVGMTVNVRVNPQNPHDVAVVF